MSGPKNHQDLSLLLSAGAAPPALAAHLDALEGVRRIEEVRSLSARDLATLYERCESAPPYTLNDLVPASTPAGKTVIFAGRNSLPLFRFFEKRFTRSPRGTVVGFNFQPLRPVTGPGYFTVTESGKEVLFDYTRIPDPADLPADWPAVRGNEGGIAFFVYRNLHDFCRRVSQDVVIGRATRLGRPMQQYFAIARAPSP